MIGQFFKPSWLGVVLLVLLLIVWITGIRMTSTGWVMTAPVTTPPATVPGVPAGAAPPGMTLMAEHTFGYPPVVRVNQSGPGPGELRTTGSVILWPNLLFVLAAAYAITIPLGRWITGYRRADGKLVGPHYTGRRAPAAVVIEVVLIGFALASFATPLMRGFAQTEVSAAEITLGLGMAWIVLAVPITLLVMIVRRLLYRHQNPTGRGFTVQPIEATGTSAAS